MRGIELIRLRIGIIGEPLWIRHWTSGFHRPWSELVSENSNLKLKLHRPFFKCSDNGNSIGHSDEMRSCSENAECFTAVVMTRIPDAADTEISVRYRVGQHRLMSRPHWNTCQIQSERGFPKYLSQPLSDKSAHSTLFDWLNETCVSHVLVYSTFI